jgi:hypothetical protein
MSPELRTVLWITAVGSAALFASIAGLVALMYLLTATWLFPKGERQPLRTRWKTRRGKARRRRGSVVAAGGPESLGGNVDPEPDELEHERRLRAVALAVAIAYAETSEVVRVHPLQFSSEWRVVNRVRQLGRFPPRRKAPR